MALAGLVGCHRRQTAQQLTLELRVDAGQEAQEVGLGPREVAAGGPAGVAVVVVVDVRQVGPQRVRAGLRDQPRAAATR